MTSLQWEAQDLQAYSEPQVADTFDFPEDDLMHLLIDKYFTEINVYSPLLHRPTFEAEVADKLHLRDRWFAALLLTTCALASHYVDDPRVFMDGINSEQSSGWKWFRQVPSMRESPWAAPSLYCLQLHSVSSHCIGNFLDVLISHQLSVRYLLRTSGRQACWVIVGAGLRLAQDIGLHRRKVYGTVLTPREELWKRAFW